MAIEIKELHVKLHLNNRQNEQTSAASTKHTEQSNASEQLVEEVVSQVLDILKEREER